MKHWLISSLRNATDTLTDQYGCISTTNLDIARLTCANASVQWLFQNWKLNLSFITNLRFYHCGHCEPINSLWVKMQMWLYPPNQACWSPCTSMARPKSASFTAAFLHLLARSRFSGWRGKEDKKTTTLALRLWNGGLGTKQINCPSREKELQAHS